MNKHFLIGLSLIAVTLASCSKREIELDETDPTMVKAITENLIEASATSKSEKEVFWEPGDEIAVFSGELSGKFESTLKKKPSSSAVFKGDLGLEAWPEEMDIWAVYPYSEEASFDGETITTVLPSEQIAKDGAFGKDMNLAIAHSNTSTLQFYNVGGGIRFSVTEEGIKKVIFEGLGGEVISGKVKIGFSEDGLPEIRKVISGSQFITILPPDGQETFQKDTWYYIVVIPGSLDRGYKLRFYKDSDYARKVSDNSMKIKRSFYRDMGNADGGIEYEATTTHFPETKDEWAVSEQRINDIASSSQRILEVFFSVSRTEDDIPSLVESIMQIEGVVSARINEEKDVIYIMKEDSVFMNLMLYPEPHHQSEQAIVNTRAPYHSSIWSPIESYVHPDSDNRKVLLLSPYQTRNGEMNVDKDHLSSSLDAIGFHLVPYCDNEASLDKFTADTLSKYAMVIIATHGSHSVEIDGEDFPLTGLGTGSKVGSIDFDLEEYKNLSINILRGSKGAYYFVSPNWLESSSENQDEKTYHNSIIVAFACNSYRYEDMADYFIKHGAGAYCGNSFYTKIMDYKPALNSFVDYLCKGYSVKTAAPLISFDYNFWSQVFLYTSFKASKEKDGPVFLYDHAPYNLKNSDVHNGQVTLIWENPLTAGEYKDYFVFLDDVRYKPQTNRALTTSVGLGHHTWYVTVDSYVNGSFNGTFKSKESSFDVTGETIPVKSISLDKTNLELPVGNTTTLKATILPSDATNKNVTWSSSNTSVASVSSAGEVKGIAKGTATITVKTVDGGKTANCRVTVVETKVPVSGVSLSKTTLSMAVGDTQTLTTIVTPSNATDKSVTWSSSNTSVATVSSSGVVTAKKSGTAVITVKTNDGGKKATCNVTVKETSVGGDIEGTERDSWN